MGPRPGDGLEPILAVPRVGITAIEIVGGGFGGRWHVLVAEVEGGAIFGNLDLVPRIAAAAMAQALPKMQARAGRLIRGTLACADIHDKVVSLSCR